MRQPRIGLLPKWHYGIKEKFQKQLIFVCEVITNSATTTYIPEFVNYFALYFHFQKHCELAI